MYCKEIKPKISKPDTIIMMEQIFKSPLDHDSLIMYIEYTSFLLKLMSTSIYYKLVSSQLYDIRDVGHVHNLFFCFPELNYVQKTNCVG